LNKRAIVAVSYNQLSANKPARICSSRLHPGKPGSGFHEANVATRLFRKIKDIQMVH